MLGWHDSKNPWPADHEPRGTCGKDQSPEGIRIAAFGTPLLHRVKHLDIGGEIAEKHIVAWYGSRWNITDQYISGVRLGSPRLIGDYDTMRCSLGLSLMMSLSNSAFLTTFDNFFLLDAGRT